MLWQLERDGRRSHLVGTAHFFPYHFRSDLRRLIAGARAVLLEGPLDERAVRRVIGSGKGAGGGGLFDALDAAARGRVLERLGIPGAPLDVPQLLRELVFGRPQEWFETELRTLRPWLAFFGIWTRFRTGQGWSYTMDLDAARITGELGREVRYLEAIDEQLAALESVPLRRFVHFLSLADWRPFCDGYVARYLAGDLEGLMAAARDFPTYCEPIVERRDPVLAARMLPALAEGGAVAFVGISHCPGVLAALREQGFAAAQRDSRG